MYLLYTYSFFTDSCKVGNLKSVKNVVKGTRKFNINKRDSLGYTGFMWSCQNGHISVAKYLSKHCSIILKNIYGESGLRLALLHGHTKLFCELIKGKYINKRYFNSIECMKIFVTICITKNFKAFKALLNNGYYGYKRQVGIYINYSKNKGIYFARSISKNRKQTHIDSNYEKGQIILIQKMIYHNYNINLPLIFKYAWNNNYIKLIDLLLEIVTFKMWIYKEIDIFPKIVNIVPRNISKKYYISMIQSGFINYFSPNKILKKTRSIEIIDLKRICIIFIKKNIIKFYNKINIVPHDVRKDLLYFVNQYKYSLKRMEQFSANQYKYSLKIIELCKYHCINELRKFITKKVSHNKRYNFIKNRQDSYNFINIQDSNGNNGFLLACKNGDIEIVKLLMKYSCLNLVDKYSFLNLVDKYGNTGLMLACQYGRIDIIKFLLRKYDKQYHNHINNNGETAFVIASLGRRKDICQLLYAHYRHIHNQKCHIHLSARRMFLSSYNKLRYDESAKLCNIHLYKQHLCNKKIENKHVRSMLKMAKKQYKYKKFSHYF